MNARVSLLVWTFAFVIAACGLYRVKYQVLALHNEIAKTTRALEQERESLHAAAAEWAYLSRPDRLERLSQKYLQLSPMKTVQVADMKNLDARFAQLRPHNPIVPAAIRSAADPGEEE